MASKAKPGPIYTLDISGNCDSLANENYTCMICCEQTATSHTRVSGGPYDGRLLMVHCHDCIHLPDLDEGFARIKGTLVQLAMAGLVDVVTGGPGLNGEPQLLHGDHFDPWPTHNH